MIVLACALAALASGCVSTRQLVPFPNQAVSVEDPSLSRIYVMRPTSFGSGVSMAVKDEGQLIGSTGPRGYLCWERQPGPARITSRSENTAEVLLNTEAGRAYYLLQTVHVGWWKARTGLKEVDAATGTAELAKCKPSKSAPSAAP